MTASVNEIKKNIKTIVDDKVRMLMMVPETEFKKDHGTLLKLLTDSLKSLQDIPDDVPPDWTDGESEESLLKEFE